MKEEKRHVGRPKLANSKTKSNAIIMCVIMFIIILVIAIVGINVLTKNNDFENIKGSSVQNKKIGISRTYVTVLSSNKMAKYFQFRYNGKITKGNWKSSDKTGRVTIDQNGYVKIAKNTPSMDVTITYKNEKCTMHILNSAKAVFVGNSLTYNVLKGKNKLVRNNSTLHLMDKYYAYTGRNIKNIYSNYKGSKSTIVGGRTLEQAYKGATHTKNDETTRNIVLSSNPDFIVLQEQTSKLLYSYLDAKYKTNKSDKWKYINKKITYSLNHYSKDGIYDYKYNSGDNGDEWTTLESYKQWLNYIYNVRKCKNTMTIIYIPPAPIASVVNNSLSIKDSRYKFSQSDIKKLQIEAYNEFEINLTNYINSYSNMRDKVLFAPVVETWYKIIDDGIVSINDMYSYDGRHPGPYGQYVIASSLFYTISGAPRISIANKNFTYSLWMVDKNEKVKITFDKDKINKIRNITHDYSIDYNY